VKRLGLAVAAVLFTTPVLAEEAGDVLFRMRDAYAGLEVYRDEGEIEMEDRGAGGGVVRFRFTTSVAQGRMSLRVAGAGTALGSAIPLEFARRATRPAELVELRGRLDGVVGSGAGSALWVPALLVGGPLAQPDPEALALDGEEACGDGRCHVLVGRDSAQDATYRLWVDRQDGLLRRSEAELRRGTAVRIFRVTLRPLPAGAASPGEVYSETIDVSLLSVVVRVHDGRGHAVPGLSAADFRIRLGARDVAVEAAEWIGESAPPAPAELEDGDLAGAPPPPPGRLLLFFVQTSFEPSRLRGQLQMRDYARKFLDQLRPEDQVAVVSFDSHLKLRADFTTDRERSKEALEESLRIGREPLLRPGAPPSVARTLDREAARRAANPERGLEVAARALVPIPGEKVVVFLGWGLGRYGANGVTMRPEYGDARRALEAARATVFALDVTDADYHSLEVGLQQVAADTGGTYVKTNVFPQLAIDRLEQSIAGYYLLYFRRPEDASAPQRVRIDLRDRSRGEVLAPEAIVR
jgi:VWFA-related protein